MLAAADRGRGRRALLGEELRPNPQGICSTSRPRWRWRSRRRSPQASRARSSTPAADLAPAAKGRPRRGRHRRRARSRRRWPRRCRSRRRRPPPVPPSRGVAETQQMMASWRETSDMSGLEDALADALEGIRPRDSPPSRASPSRSRWHRASSRPRRPRRSRGADRSDARAQCVPEPVAEVLHDARARRTWLDPLRSARGTSPRADARHHHRGRASLRAKSFDFAAALAIRSGTGVRVGRAHAATALAPTRSTGDLAARRADRAAHRAPRARALPRPLPKTS